MLFGHFFSLVEGWPPIVSLAIISLVAGLAMLWVFGRISDQEAIAKAKKSLAAHLYELRLFADEPALIWRAQKELLIGNVRYLALMLKPAIVLTIPMVFLLVQLESFYGIQPLPVGSPAIVTLKVQGPIPAESALPLLEAPQGIAVETPPVRVPGEGLICWRIRPTRPVAGTLRIAFRGASLEKALASGRGPRYLSTRRVSSALGQFVYPAESRLKGDTADWIEIRYPGAEVSCFGLGLHWLIWFLVISLASAWLLRKRFGVAL